MIPQKQLEEFRRFLEKAQNPLFLFDNDVDGLASFLLLARFCGRGKGVAIKSFPELSTAYSRKLYELKPDYVFVLDKPLIEEGFRDSAKKLNIPIIWLDHHPIPNYSDEEEISYFNPIQEDKESKTISKKSKTEKNKTKKSKTEKSKIGSSNEPTSYWAYKITKNKKDEWIAMIGCLADWYIPEFAESFSKKYPDLFHFTKNPAIALYETELGRIRKMLNFALMDRTTAVVRMLKNLLKIKDPRELLDVTNKTISIYKRYKQINKKYEKILNKAKGIEKTNSNSKLLFFQYGGELSLSAELSNELFYLYPNKVIVVAYIKGTKVNVSVRGNTDVRKLTSNALKGIESTSGGHKQAVGASLSVEDIPKFRDNLIKLLRE